MAKLSRAAKGSKTYKVHLPKDVPARDFWSFTLLECVGVCVWIAGFLATV
jgi:hypothetical protein